MTNAMQITFAATEREKRQAGRRLCRYREPALRRKQWLGMAAFTLMMFVFFYGYGQLMANVLAIRYTGIAIYSAMKQVWIFALRSPMMLINPCGICSICWVLCFLS